MAASKKPRGFGRFADALRTVVNVDKAAVEKRIERDKAKRVKRAEKK